MPPVELRTSQQPEASMKADVQMLDGQTTVTIEGVSTSLALIWDSPASGWARETQTGKNYRFFSRAWDDQLELWLDGCIYRFALPARKRTDRRRGATSHAPAGGDVKAPMPGSILKILVELGTKVSANTPLVIMESMKMEMTLTAPVDGTVKAVHCQAGQMVEMNTVLVALEVAKDA